MRYKYFLPGFYLYHSRLKRKSEILSLLYIYPIFLYMYIFLWGDFILWSYSVVFILAFFIWLSFYEIGYFENDVITTKKEKNPTLRISDDESKLIDRSFSKIVLGRILLGSLGILFLNFIANSINVQVNILLFIIVIIVARCAFYLHNKIRNRWNILTYFFLSISKYLSLPFLLYPNFSNFPLLIISLLIIFPVLRTIEHSAKTKYNFKTLGKWIGNLDLFRIKYYSMVMFFIGITYVVTKNQYFLYILIGISWFYVFRIFIYMLTRFGAYKRTEFKSHKWKR